MNRVVIQEGYSLPFAGMRRRKRRAAKRGGSKMKKCAMKWRKSAKRGKYIKFMKSCMKKRG